MDNYDALMRLKKHLEGNIPGYDDDGVLTEAVRLLDLVNRPAAGLKIYVEFAGGTRVEVTFQPKISGPVHEYSGELRFYPNGADMVDPGLYYQRDHVGYQIKPGDKLVFEVV